MKENTHIKEKSYQMETWSYTEDENTGSGIFMGKKTPNKLILLILQYLEFKKIIAYLNLKNSTILQQLAQVMGE